MTSLPLFPVTSVGSWPRPQWLRTAMKRNSQDLPELQRQATLLAIKEQEAAGVDIVTDGEQRRDNFFSFIASRVEGMKLMTLAELLNYVEDKAAFESLLSALDVPSFAISNPTVNGKLKVKESIAVDDAQFLQAHTQKAVKVALPGPYLLSRSTWVKDLSAKAYPTRESLAADIVALLRKELIALVEMGVDMIQFDEPVLTELVFTGKAATRTFMCAALAASAEPEEELDFAVELINQVVDGIEGSVLGLHVCRGNWSSNEDVLLQGSYDKLMPTLQRMNVDQFVLEYATPRAGSLDSLRQLPKTASLGLGAVDPRTDEIESIDEVYKKAHKVAEILGPERIYLNPDCGFATFTERPVNDRHRAVEKLKVLVAVAKRLRRDFQ